MATYIEGIQTPVGQTNAIESHESYIPPRCVLIIPLREQVYNLLVRKKRFGNVSSNRWRFRSIRRTTDQHFSRPLLVKRPSLPINDTEYHPTAKSFVIKYRVGGYEQPQVERTGNLLNGLEKKHRLSRDAISDFVTSVYRSAGLLADCIRQGRNWLRGPLNYSMRRYLHGNALSLSSGYSLEKFNDRKPEWSAHDRIP